MTGVFDGDPCTSDACTPTTGCTYVPLSDGVTCDDGDASTGPDICKGAICNGK